MNQNTPHGGLEASRAMVHETLPSATGTDATGTFVAEVAIGVEMPLQGRSTDLLQLNANLTLRSRQIHGNRPVSGDYQLQHIHRNYANIHHGPPWPKR
jgi:hypothetical protein